MSKKYTLDISISDITEAQKIALEDLFATWVQLGKLGSSRWTAFFADGDGNFRPIITINGQTPQHTTLLSKKEVWKGDEYRIDFDAIAWKLKDND